MIKKFNVSLKYKLTIFVSILILILFLLTNYIIMKYEKNSLYENLILRGNSWIDNFSLYCENAFFTGDELNIEDYVTVIMKEKEVKNIYIVLKNLTYFLNNNQDLLGKKYIAPQKVEVNLKQNYNTIKRNNQVLYQFYKPIYQLNEKGKRILLGMGYIELTTDIIKGKLNQIRLKLTLIFLLLLINGILGAFILSQLMIDPIKKLVKGINIIAKGNLKYKIRIRTRDEIENLANEFNRMTTQLFSYQKKLIKQKIVEQELQIAKNIQSQIIPERLMEINKYDLFNFHRTSRIIGGDYHNLIPINNKEYLFIIADVSGKGVPASLLMVMFHTILITLKKIYNKPLLLMKETNNIMSTLLKKGNFITVIIGLINTSTGRIKMVSAGHEYPVLINFKNKSLHFLQSSGAPIGLFNIKDFKSKLKLIKFTLLKDNMVVFYTDGLRHVQKKPMNNKDVSHFFKSLLDNSDNYMQFKEQLMDKVRLKKYNDDITIVGIRRK